MKMIKKLVLVTAVMLAMLGLAACSGGTSAGSTQTTTNNAKKVSFVQEARGNGNYVWLTVNTEGGLTKDSVVSLVHVLSNGKMTTYQIYDNNITVGDLSKKSDADVIKLAKVQDKKYATAGAIKEIHAWMKFTKKNESGSYPQVGQEADFDEHAQSAARGGYYLYYTSADEESTAMDGVNVEKINGYTRTESDGEVTMAELAPAKISKSNNNKGFGDYNYAKAIIQSIKSKEYQAPTAHAIKVKNTTDASGNKIVAQAITYQAIDMFDGHQAFDNQYKFAQKRGSDFIKLTQLGVALSYDNGTDETAVAQAAQEALYDKLIKPNYNTLVKNVYGYHTWNRTDTLSKTIKQQIYKERYIGYSTGMQSIVTKAQTKQQRATFAK